MSDKPKFNTGSKSPLIYQIKLEGHLNDRWSTWFEGMTIEQEETGITVLTGPVADQAALFGLLRKVRDLGLILLAVNCICHDATDMN